MYLGIPKCTLSTCCLNIASTWVLKSHCEQLYIYIIPWPTRFTGRGTVGRNGGILTFTFWAMFTTLMNVFSQLLFTNIYNFLILKDTKQCHSWKPTLKLLLRIVRIGSRIFSIQISFFINYITKTIYDRLQNCDTSVTLENFEPGAVILLWSILVIWKLNVDV